MDLGLSFHLENVLRVFITGALGYLGVVAILRVSGNRTLSKMNSFDFVVTIAMGSALSAGILQKSVQLVDMLVAIGVLVLGQWIFTWACSRSKRMSRIIKSQPILIYYEGRFLKDNMHRARVSEEEVKAAAREAGSYEMKNILYVVLESNGKLSAGKI